MSNQKTKNNSIDASAVLKSYHDGIKYLREYNDDEFKIIAKEIYLKSLEKGEELSFEMERELYSRDINPKDLLN